MPFKRGDPNINRSGRPKNSERGLLKEALEAEGKKRGIDFWKIVAEKAFEDTKIMSMVVKKFIPDLIRNQTEGELKITQMPTITIEGKPMEFDIG